MRRLQNVWVKVIASLLFLAGLVPAAEVQQMIILPQKTTILSSGGKLRVHCLNESVDAPSAKHSMHALTAPEVYVTEVSAQGRGNPMLLSKAIEDGILTVRGTDSALELEVIPMRPVRGVHYEIHAKETGLIAHHADDLAAYKSFLDYGKEVTALHETLNTYRQAGLPPELGKAADGLQQTVIWDWTLLKGQRGAAALMSQHTAAISTHLRKELGLDARTLESTVSKIEGLIERRLTSSEREAIQQLRTGR